MEDDSAEWEEPQEVEMGGAFPGLAEAALGALGELAENCGSALLPYLDSSLSAILDLTQFPLCQLRAAAYEALGSVCCCGRERQTAPSPVHQGALQALLKGLRTDPEVGGALGAVGGVGRILQPPGHAHKEWLEPIGRALCDVIAGEIACLRSRGDGDEDEVGEGLPVQTSSARFDPSPPQCDPSSIPVRSQFGPSSIPVPPNLSQSLLALLRQVGGADPQRFREGVASLDPAHAAILCRMLDDVISSQ
ncbi:importin-4-like [Pyrgilauda ruficollis]|uniref:importin-4-like n=1 Tax=Pyrgilauda ruficollis TaxID=221976 RepID=UPI001B85DF13|nr:importin-4-like [Pyrgilauda ruficollis]